MAVEWKEGRGPGPPSPHCVGGGRAGTLHSGALKAAVCGDPGARAFAGEGGLGQRPLRQGRVSPQQGAGQRGPLSLPCDGRGGGDVASCLVHPRFQPRPHVRCQSVARPGPGHPSAAHLASVACVHSMDFPPGNMAGPWHKRWGCLVEVIHPFLLRCTASEGRRGVTPGPSTADCGAARRREASRRQRREVAAGTRGGQSGQGAQGSHIPQESVLETEAEIISFTLAADPLSAHCDWDT